MFLSLRLTDRRNHLVVMWWLEVVVVVDLTAEGKAVER